VRIAIAIGADANIEELSKFCSHPKENPPLVADRAVDLMNNPVAEITGYLGSKTL